MKGCEFFNLTSTLEFPEKVHNLPNYGLPLQAAIFITALAVGWKRGMTVACPICHAKDNRKNVF